MSQYILALSETRPASFEISSINNYGKYRDMALSQSWSWFIAGVRVGLSFTAKGIDDSSNMNLIRFNVFKARSFLTIQNNCFEKHLFWPTQ